MHTFVFKITQQMIFIVQAVSCSQSKNMFLFGIRHYHVCREYLSLVLFIEMFLKIVAPNIWQTTSHETPINMVCAWIVLFVEFLRSAIFIEVGAVILVDLEEMLISLLWHLLQSDGTNIPATESTRLWSRQFAYQNVFGNMASQCSMEQSYHIWNTACSPHRL